MRIAVNHTQTLQYEAPGQGTIQVVRLTPRDHQGQYVCEWSLDVDADCKLQTSKDGFGNIVTSFSVSGPLETLVLQVTGEVETDDTLGIVKGASERMPNGVYRRTADNAATVSMAKNLLNTLGAPEQANLDFMHALMGTLHDVLNPADEKSNDVTQSQMQASEAPRTQPGAVARLRTQISDQEKAGFATHASVLAQAARFAGLPARIVSGYAMEDGKPCEKTNVDTWAEAYIDELGWVGFDPLTGKCPSQDSIRIAIGIAEHDILPTRIGHYGVPGAFEHTSRIALDVIGR